MDGPCRGVVQMGEEGSVVSYSALCVLADLLAGGGALTGGFWVSWAVEGGVYVAVGEGKVDAGAVKEQLWLEGAGRLWRLWRLCVLCRVV